MPIYNLIEYSSNYSETTEKLWFYEATNFDADITNNNFKYFEYKAKLLENTVVDGANQILRNETIAVTLKYSSNFQRSPKMSLINCKIELKLKLTKYCVLSLAGADNLNANFNNVIFNIKDSKL